MIQAVNVTSGAVYYNSTGGVSLWTPTTISMSSIGIGMLVGTNKTGSCLTALLTYTDSSSTTTGTKVNYVPITLATGAIGSVILLGTGSSATVTNTAQTFNSMTTTVTSAGLTTFLTLAGSASTGTVTSTLVTTTSAFLTSYTTISTTSTSTGETIVTAVTTTLYGPEYSTSSTTTTTTDTAVSTTMVLYSTSSTSTTIAYSLTATVVATSTVAGSLTSTLYTSYSAAGAWGSLSTYGVTLVQTIYTHEPLTLTDTYVYANSFFINGSSAASATMNLTNPSGYHLAMTTGYSTSDGFGLFQYYASTTSGSPYLVNKDTYFGNGTAVLSVSMGTYGAGSYSGGSNAFPQTYYGGVDLQPFLDATGSPWIGINVGDRANSSYPIVNGYAGEAAYVAGANSLTTIFATLALMIAALFAF